MRVKLTSKEDREILNWLTAVDYGPQQSDFLRLRQPGTGSWLLDSVKYHNWVDGRNKTLFCPGIPGAGKTILSSIVVDDLLHRFCNADVGVAYVYFNFQRKDEQNLDRLLASLLKQLCQAQPTLPLRMRNLYDEHHRQKTRPSSDELLDTLRSVARLYSRTFLILDAMNVKTRAAPVIGYYLSSNIQRNLEANIFATSRFIPEITGKFDKRASVEVRATKEDVKRYVEGNIRKLPLFVQNDQPLQRVITTIISEAVDGMFLLARLYLSSLEDKFTDNEIRSALKQLQKQGQESDKNEHQQLEEIYNRIMENIMKSKLGKRNLAMSALSWVTCAKRPLTTSELVFAIAVRQGRGDCNRGDLPHVGDIVSLCAGLLIVDEQSDVIRLVHYTTQEYFDRTWSRWLPDAESDITEACVTYVSNRILGPDTYGKEKGSAEFYQYSLRYWGQHARKAATFCHGILKLLESDGVVEATIQAQTLTKKYIQERLTGLTGLHLAAYFGITEAVSRLLRCGHNADNSDYGYITPLGYASRAGHEVVVELLLAKGAKTNAGRCWTPLHYAAEGGHEAVVKLLIANGAEIDAGYREPSLCPVDVKIVGKTSLSYAAARGHEAIVKLLLESGAEIDSMDVYCHTPLYYAATYGHAAVFEFLLAKGAKIESEMLLTAARNGCDTVVKHLLKDRVLTKSMNIVSQSLSHAAEQGHETIIKLLLEKGAPIDFRGDLKRTPLSLAAKEGKDTTCQLLIEKGAEIESKDKDGRTALSLAAEEGKDTTCQLLIEKGANIESKGGYMGGPPLSHAARWGKDTTCLLLLEKGAEIESKDRNGRTPLSHAAASYGDGKCKVLLERGADIESRDNNGRTPLSHAAASCRDDTTCKVLLERGADIESRDNSGRTPVLHAAILRNEAIIVLLFEKGADIESKDKRGFSGLNYHGPWRDNIEQRLRRRKAGIVL